MDKKLRIFCVIHETGTSYKGSKTWYHNFYDSLVDMGHNVELLTFDILSFSGSDENKTAQLRARLSEQILNKFRKEHRRKPFDVFFSYVYSRNIDKTVIQEIKQMGVPTMNFFCNEIHQFDLISEIAPSYDFCLTPFAAGLDKYKNIGANPVFFPFAVNPSYYSIDVNKSIKEYDVSFVGTYTIFRVPLLVHLANAGIDVQIFGPAWQRDFATKTEKISRIARKFHKGIDLLKNPPRLFSYLRRKFLPKVINPEAKMRQLYEQERERCLPFCHGSISDEQVLAVFRNSKINLNNAKDYCPDGSSFRCRDNYVKHLRLKDFEIPAAGGFMLTEYQKELPFYYEIGKEIESFGCKEELLDKVKYYLQHDREREKIRKAGHERVLKSHTYQRRFRELFENILRT